MRTPTSSTPGAIVHCRVSSTKQAYEGESLDTQARICCGIAEARNWTLMHEPWKESFSGRKVKRPVFEDILDFLDVHPSQVQYYIFRSIDRFTRDGSFTYERMRRELAKRGVEMVDSLGIIQPSHNTLADLGVEYEWSRVRPSEIAEMVVATSAKHEVSTILTRLIGQEITLRRRGFKIRPATDGYENRKLYDADGKRRTIEVPDPERAAYFIAMFELRASGQYTDQEICDRVNVMGYRSKPVRMWNKQHTQVLGRRPERPLVPKRLQEIIQRPIYCGVICEKWTNWLPVRAAYPGLVSIDLFNRANNGKIYVAEVGGGLAISKDGTAKAILSRNNPLFLFRHVVLCPRCRKPLMGSSPRGRSGQHFPTYHCARQHRYFGVSKVTLERTLTSYAQNLTFQPAAVESTFQEARQTFEHRAKALQQRAKHRKENRVVLEGRKSELARAFGHATTDLMRRSLENEIENLQLQIDAVGDNPKDTTAKSDLEDFLDDVQRVMEQPALLLKNGTTPEQMRSLYSLVFAEFPTYDELVAGTAKKRWIFSASSHFPTSQSVLGSGLN
jgi:hypothetical protein